MPFNWIDWVIVVVLLYYGFQGWQAGFADLGLSLVTFLISLFLSIKFHAPVGNFLSQKFGIPEMWTNVLGYIIVAFIAEAILGELMNMLLDKLPKKLIRSVVNKWLGLLVSVVNGLIVITFLLLVILALPIRGTIKKDIQASTIGKVLVSWADKYGGEIRSTLDQAKQEALKFTTVEPGSNERIALDVSPVASDLHVDDVDERRLLDLVNQERVNAGVVKLTVDVRLVAVAREHSRDMFLRRYFSHVTPEGLTAGDRITKAGISYTVAGENLAYAPDVDTAHQGLMNSPGHRRNILDPTFHHIGIGIISTDTWGMMVTEDFTN